MSVYLPAFLTKQFAACNSQKDWFSPLQSALDGLTAEQAAWKLDQTNHCIWELVNHLLFWNERHYLRLTGATVPPMEGDNKATFATTTHTNENWALMLHKLSELMAAFEQEIGRCDEQKLDSFVSEQIKVKWCDILSNINIHNAYHIGQIVLLRKIQESWDAARNGVAD